MRNKKFVWRTYTLQETEKINFSKKYNTAIGSVNIQNNSGKTIYVNKVPVINGRLFELKNYSDSAFIGDLDIKIPFGNSVNQRSQVFIYLQVFES